MKFKLKKGMALLLLFTFLVINLIPNNSVKAATCKKDTYTYYFLAHLNEESDYEELMAATSNNPIDATSTGHFINLWGDDAKIVDEEVSTSFTDADIKMYWDLIIKGDYIKNSSGYHIYHQAGFSIGDGDISTSYSSTQRYVRNEIKNTNSSEYNAFVKEFKKALVNPSSGSSSVWIDENTLNQDQVAINVKRVYSSDNLSSDFERYHLVYDDIDGYVFYIPMKYTVTIEHDCEEEVTPPTPEEPENNAQTFDLPIFIVWGVGGAALIYSIYYFRKYYKSQKENV